MADEVELVQIDATAINAAIDKTTVNIIELTAAQKALREDSKKTDKQLEEEGKERKNLSKQMALNGEKLKGLKKERGDNIKLLTAEVGSLDQLKKRNAQLIKDRQKLNLNTKAGRKELAKINAELKRNQAQITKNSEGFADFTGNQQKMTESMSAMPGSVGRIGGAFTQLKTVLMANPILLIITGIVAAFAAMRAALQRSEEGQNALAKIGAVLGTALNVLLDIFTGLAEAIVSAFSDPKQAVIDLWQVIKENLVNRIQGVADLFIGLKDVGVNTFKLIGASIKNVWSDNQAAVDEAKNNIVEAAKEMGTALVQAGTGLDAEGQAAALQFVVDKMREVSEEARIAADLANRQAALDKLARDTLVDTAELRREISELRAEASDKEGVAAQDRLDALDKAIALEGQILELNQSIAQEKVNLKAAQNALGASTKEDLDEEAQLRAELIALETANANARRKLQSERQTAIREIAAEETAIESRRQAAVLKLTELEAAALVKTAENLEAKKELLIAAENEEFARLIQNKDLLDEELELLEVEHLATLAKINEDYRIKQAKEDEKAAAKKKQGLSSGASSALGINNNLFSAISSGQQLALDAQLAAAEGNEEKQDEIRREFAKKQQSAAVGKALIGGALAIIQAFAQLGPIAGAIAAVAVGATTGVQISQIKKQKFANGGEVKAWNVSGPSHAQGGIPLTIGGRPAGEIEGNEGVYVVNKRDNPAAIAALSSINSVSGKSFAPSNYMQDGGEAVAAAGGMTFEQALAIAEARPVVVQVVDINDGQAIEAQVIGNGEI